MRLAAFTPSAFRPQQFTNTQTNRDALKDGDFVKFFYGAGDKQFWQPMIGRFEKQLKGGFSAYTEDGWHFPEWSRLVIVYVKKDGMTADPASAAIEKTLDKMIERFTSKGSLKTGITVHDSKKDAMSKRTLVFMCGEDDFISLEFDPTTSKLEAFDDEGTIIALEFKKNGDITKNSLNSLEEAILALNLVK